MVRRGGPWHPGHTPLTGTDTWPGWVWEESWGLGRDERPWGKPASTFLIPPAVLQSVLCGADALIPVQTGAAGSARLTLLGNGSLIYQVRVSSCPRWRAAGQGGALACPVQTSSLLCHSSVPSPTVPPQVQVVGTGSEVVALTLETKPQRRNQRTVLCHMAGLQLGGHTVSAVCRARPWAVPRS